jgi:hypothetical protein
MGVPGIAPAAAFDLEGASPFCPWHRFRASSSLNDRQAGSLVFTQTERQRDFTAVARRRFIPKGSLKSSIFMSVR